MTKQKDIKDMTLQEQKEWLERYLADEPKRLAEYDRFSTYAAVSLGMALISTPIVVVIAMWVSEYINR